MKKFLSLVLALVMTMSLVTISAGAKDFTDDEAITYDEAVAVISAVKVVDGYTDGSFKPTATLTRGAAAKIICNLILGPTTAAELPASVAPFSDVPANSTFAGYIAYCAKEGIVGGYADGTFKPGASLTGYAFMKMLLGALGYDAEIEGYNDPKTWSISVAKQALGIGLNAGLLEDFNGVKAVTREEACLYAFNTLKATMVDYDTKTSVNVGDATVTIAGSTAKPVAWNNMNVQTGINNDGHIDADGFVQFAEQYFTKLEVENTLDVFGRPARTWDYKGDEIGTYVAWDLQVEEYTEKVTGKDLYDLLGKGIIDDKDYDINVYIDGEDSIAVDGNIFNRTAMNKNNKDGVGKTGDGVLTQVFVSSDTKEVFVCIINTYLAIAKADYSEKKDSVSFDVYMLTKVGTNYVKGKGDVTMTITGEDFAIAKDVKEKGAYLVNVAEGEIQIVTPAEVIDEATITSFKLGSNVVADGEKYSYAATAYYNDEVLDDYTTTANGLNMKDLTYKIYLDEYGFLIGVDLVEEADNYLFITGADANGSNLTNKNMDANALFLDGTSATIKINTQKSSNITASPVINKWYTYTTDKDGVYTVKEVAPATSTTPKVKVAQEETENTTIAIDKKHVSLPGDTGSGFAKVYGNENTVYLTAEMGRIVQGTNWYAVIKGVENVTTGVNNANLTTYTDAQAQAAAKGSATMPGGATWADTSSGVYTLYKDNGYVIAAVVVGKDDAASKNLVYVNSSNVEVESYNAADDEWTWSRKVISNGEEIEITEKGDSLSYIGNAANSEGIMAQYGWFQVKYNAAGNVIGVVPAATALDTNNNGVVDNTDEFVDDIAMVETAVNAHDKVLYSETCGTALSGVAVPSLKGSTLYVGRTQAEGFFVASDVKIVLIQKNDNKTTTTYETGVKNLEDVLSEMNTDAAGKCFYTVSAMLNEGAASIVVIQDHIATGNAGQKPTTAPAGIPAASVSTATMTVTVPVTTANKAEALDLAIAALQKAGYTVEGVSYGAGEYTLDASKGSVSGYRFTTNTVVYYKMNWKVNAATYPGWEITGPTYVADDATEVTVSVKYTPGGVLVVDLAASTGLVATNTTGTAISSTPVDVKLTIGTAPTADADVDMAVTIH